MRKFYFWFVLLTLTCSTAFAFDYKGDGTFVDTGRMTGFERYRLVLPPVDLCKKGSYSFFIGKLPADSLFLQVEYVLPVSISDEEALKLVNTMSQGIVISFRLDDIDNNSEIYSYQGKLFESGLDSEGRYWRNGFPGVVDKNGKKILFKVEAVEFHKGLFWQNHSGKRLQFSVVASNLPLAQCSANFVVTGGGWK